MCSIIGVIRTSKTSLSDELLKGLKMLEYRGYDSAGLAIKDGGTISVFKTKNENGQQAGADALAEVVRNSSLSTFGTLAIGHTRWATHGVPSEKNAHPHVSKSGRFVLVHNGIVENFKELKEMLQQKGYHFKSETDTEVLVNLIDEIYTEAKGILSFSDAVMLALERVVGAFSIAVISTFSDEMIVASQSGSLSIGILPGGGGFMIASDESSFIGNTESYFHVEEASMVVLTQKKHTVISLETRTEIFPRIQILDKKLEEIQKGTYKFFMEKEIHEQPETLRNAFRGRIHLGEGIIRLRGIEDYLGKFVHAKRIIIVGCGTSWHAGLIGEYLIEQFARIPVEVEYASEFRYRNPVLSEKDLVIAISQSGETADTIAAVELAKAKGATVIGICNVVGSAISRKTDAGVYLHIGPEISVASTKAFTGQVAVLSLIALLVGRKNGMLSESKYQKFLTELATVPDLLEKNIPEWEYKIKEIALKYQNAKNMLYLGRGYSFPVALEGALKLKEVSYIHAEGYPAAEMKHGPIALIDEHMPVVVIATQNDEYLKVCANVQEVNARKGAVIALVTEGDTDVSAIVSDSITIPAVLDMFSPLLTAIPLQLLAYYIANEKGLNVDKPRNLAKSVTTE